MKGQKYSKYREAWHLLLNAARGPERPPLDSCMLRSGGNSGGGERRDADVRDPKNVPETVP
jgi:hypothetical protein